MKYYAVRKGFQCGIFNSWEECKLQVHKFKGAEFKSFNTLEEANDFLNRINREIKDKKKLKRTQFLMAPSFAEKEEKKKFKLTETESDDHYTLKFDGGSRGNPGSGGSGAFLTTPKGEVCWEGYFYHGSCTNNQAEYQGLIEGLRHARRAGIKKLNVMGDSNTVIEQMKGTMKVINEQLKILREEATAFASGFEHITYKHVYRQANGRADRLANLAMDTEKSYSEWKVLE